jgi:hypothetical protein
MAGAFLGYTLEIDEVVERLDVGTIATFDFGIQTASIGGLLPIFND